MRALTHTHTHTHTHILMHSHITDEDGRTGGKNMKCLWLELQSTREQKNSEGDLQRLELKNNSETLCSFPFSDDFLLQTP